MNVNVEKKEKNQVKIDVIVEDEEFQKAILKSYKKNVSSLNVQGFRRGKAPFNYIKRIYGEDVFYEDAIKFCIDDTYPVVIKENSVKPIDQPEFEIVEVGKGNGFRYNIIVTVQPDIILGQYKDLKIESMKYPVTDEEVDKELMHMREKNVVLEDKQPDSVLEDKDLAIIDFIGYINEIPFEGGEGEDYSLEIGSKTFIDNFEEQLIGMKVGDTKDIFVTFPEDYGKEELRGKEAKFVVTLKNMKVKVFPELDDEFAKDVSEFDTLEELRKSIKKKLEDKNLELEKREAEEKLFEMIIKNSEADIPEFLIDREIDNMILGLEFDLKRQGIDLNENLVYAGITQEKMRNNMRESAINSIKMYLIIDKISEVEMLNVSEEEIDNEIANTYQSNRSQKFADKILKNQRDSIMNKIKKSKVIDFLMQENIV